MANTKYYWLNMQLYHQAMSKDTSYVELLDKNSNMIYQIGQVFKSKTHSTYYKNVIIKQALPSKCWENPFH